MFGAWLLGWSNHCRIWLAKQSFRRCCALRLEGMSQVGILGFWVINHAFKQVGNCESLVGGVQSFSSKNLQFF
jgi:hypothetical protein